MNKYNDLVTTNGKFRYKTSKKEKMFEYIVLELLKWWKEANPNKEIYDNDLGTLKVMKLLFFTVASSTNSYYHNSKKEVGLLEIFDKWYARPYGHIEGDIDELIRFRKGKFKSFEITPKQIILL